MSKNSSVQLAIHPGKPHEGRVWVSGFKHLLVPCMLATFGLSSSNIILTNVPEILDKKILCEIMEYLGCIIHQSQDTLTINTTNACSKAIPEHLTDKIHGAIYLTSGIVG
ncbi:MAG: hypothetical protein LRY69_04710 [Gammaproteobacteria bacterium]|nr:hypothetical protein [Gammaproteobacteria bacterium]